MKLYAFFSTNIGEDMTLAVNAHSADEAREKVSRYIAERWPQGGSVVAGWPDGWLMDVAEIGEVICDHARNFGDFVSAESKD